MGLCPRPHRLLFCCLVLCLALLSVEDRGGRLHREDSVTAPQMDCRENKWTLSHQSQSRCAGFHPPLTQQREAPYSSEGKVKCILRSLPGVHKRLHRPCGAGRPHRAAGGGFSAGGLGGMATDTSTLVGVSAVLVWL